jgi:hypothetical protein
MPLIDLPARGIQGALNLVRRATPSQALFEKSMIRGPRGEYYAFPRELPLDERGGLQGIRDVVNAGIVKPIERMPLGEVPAGKAQKGQNAARLATSVLRGLPRQSYVDPGFDAIALKMHPTGVKADALAALDSPETINEPGVAYLYDLAAALDAPGAGEHLLDSILKGPLFPDADRIVFTPLEKARDFYQKRFGAEYMSPLDALSDGVIAKILDSAGAQHLAEDLGVGIIRRAGGGLVQMRNG